MTSFLVCIVRRATMLRSKQTYAYSTYLTLPTMATTDLPIALLQRLKHHIRYETTNDSAHEILFLCFHAAVFSYVFIDIITRISH